MNTRKVQISFDEIESLLGEIIESGNAAELTVTGNSMRPMLLDRKSVVRISAPQSLRRGDVVLFRHSSGKYLLHRIVACGEDGTVCCRGDANTVCESGISAEQVLATVTDFRRETRWTSCRSFGYGCYWRLWLITFPLRVFAFRVRRYVTRKREVAQ